MVCGRMCRSISREVVQQGDRLSRRARQHARRLYVCVRVRMCVMAWLVRSGIEYRGSRSWSAPTIGMRV